jgi:hypothetical protein
MLNGPARRTAHRRNDKCRKVTRETCARAKDRFSMTFSASGQAGKHPEERSMGQKSKRRVPLRLSTAT